MLASSMRLGGVAILSLTLVLVTSCGGARSGGSEAGATPVRVEPAGDPTDGGRRRAAEAALCDYGGSAERTCQRGLYCCYGPPADPGEHGDCRPECPEY